MPDINETPSSSESKDVTPDIVVSLLAGFAVMVLAVLLRSAVGGGPVVMTTPKEAPATVGRSRSQGSHLLRSSLAARAMTGTPFKNASVFRGVCTAVGVATCSSLQLGDCGKTDENLPGTAQSMPAGLGMALLCGNEQYANQATWRVMRTLCIAAASPCSPGPRAGGGLPQASSPWSQAGGGLDLQVGGCI